MRLRFCPSRGWAPSGDAHVMSSLQALCVGQAHSFRQTRTRACRSVVLLL